MRGNEYLLSATGPVTEMPAGGTARFHEKLFVGPKLQAQLAATGPSLELTADYGKLTVLAQPLFWLLKWIHGLIGNWGWSIIIVTALIKLLFYPLSQASGRSMAKMRAVAPRIKQIQETYKDDREKLGRAMMELYKKEKINPLAGCLPMVVQIPFFISFYWVLLESVEMRQAPFMLWINDLSARDPFFVLPLLMGGAMFAQFKLNPAPPDPMQAKIMQFMPLVMTGMMAWFPSGLVLYWLTNTVLSDCAAVAGQPGGRSRSRQEAQLAGSPGAQRSDSIVAALHPGRTRRRGHGARFRSAGAAVCGRPARFPARAAACTHAPRFATPAARPSTAACDLTSPRPPRSPANTSSSCRATAVRWSTTC